MHSFSDFRKAFLSFGADHGRQGPLNWHSCRSPRYAQHLHMQGFSSDAVSSLRLPANRRLLFFGHSYLRQVFDNILSANADLLTSLHAHSFENAPNFSRSNCSGQHGDMNMTVHPVKEYLRGMT